MDKITKVAILGVGARGADVYGNLMYERPETFSIVSLCDRREERLERFGDKFGVDKSLRFTDENEFFKEKRADLIVIATQDKDHVRHCLKAFETGYDVLLEKPVTDKREECDAILAAQKKYGRKTLVCHVLRYAPAFIKVAELLDNNEIGTLVCIDALERVAFWHQAHSYVRGNWRDTDKSTPMILAKCCHDLDLLQYYANSKCVSVSSIGELAHFRKENAPEGAAARCVDCKYADTCIYSAKKFYIDRWKKSGQPKDDWPYNVAAAAPVTEEKLRKAIAEGIYGRCVYACDNNAVDHQITQMMFENGVKASLTMTAFTAEMGRRMYFHGTHGEIILDETEKNIRLHRFGEDAENISFDSIKDTSYGHGGGDLRLIEELVSMLRGDADARTSLEKSIESHLMGICAEESRLRGGELVYIRKK